MDTLSIVVVAGGQGRRMGHDLAKQYIDLCGKPILMHTLHNLNMALPNSELIVVVPNGDSHYVQDLLRKFGMSSVKVTNGGKSRAESVFNGLQLAQRDYVAIHDAVRPFVTTTLLRNLLDNLPHYGSIIPAVKSTDSIRLLENKEKTRAIDRNTVLMVQTPQCFLKEYLVKAYKEYFNSPLDFLTDDASIVEYYLQCTPKIVPGDYNNIKITTPKDLAIAKYIFEHYNERQYT